MNKKCKCGGTLERAESQQDYFVWKCPLCGTTVIQRKRTPYKLDAERDIKMIEEHITKLLIRNPMTEKNMLEWTFFVASLNRIKKSLDLGLANIFFPTKPKEK